MITVNFYYTENSLSIKCRNTFNIKFTTLKEILLFHKHNNTDIQFIMNYLSNGKWVPEKITINHLSKNDVLPKLVGYLKMKFSPEVILKTDTNSNKGPFLFLYPITDPMHVFNSPWSNMPLKEIMTYFEQLKNLIDASPGAKKFTVDTYFSSYNDSSTFGKKFTKRLKEISDEIPQQMLVKFYNAKSDFQNFWYNSNQDIQNTITQKVIIQNKNHSEKQLVEVTQEEKEKIAKAILADEYTDKLIDLMFSQIRLK